MSTLPSVPFPVPAAVQILPQFAVASYLVCVAGAGVLANAAVVAALFRRERNVFHSIVLQLAVSDALLLCGAASFETWSRNEGTWIFGCIGCITYLGLEVFASTASVYFVVTLVLHAIATANLEESNAKSRRSKNREDDASDAEMRSSRHSLVANSDSSTPPRTMNIDYRIANSFVPVVIPVVFVWILAASLSVPEFSLATTVHLENGLILCTFVDPSHRINMHSLLAAFDLFIPAFILSTAGAVAIRKIRKRRRKICGENSEADSALTLSLCLVAVYLLMCVPRSALAVFHAYSTPRDEATGASKFHNPVLSGGATPPGLGLTLTCLNYAAALLRPVICVLVLPDVRRSFTTRTFTDRSNAI